MRSRIQEVDATRGIAIILIVLGHSLRGASIYSFLYSFHVPLCFLVSGFCFNSQKKRGEIVNSIISRLYIPYLFASAVSIFLYITEEYVLNHRLLLWMIPRFVYGMIYGNGDYRISGESLMIWNLPLWFIPCLIVVQLIAHVLICEFDERINKVSYCLIIIVVLTVINEFTYKSDIKIQFPFGAETAIYMLPFFMIGHVLRVLYNEAIICDFLKSKSAGIFGGMLICAGVSLFFLNSNIDYVSDHYGNGYFLFEITALFICVGIFCITWNMPFMLLNILCAVGTNTLPILMFHKIIIMAFITVIVKGRETTLVEGIIITSISILASIIIGHFIGKICPEVIGDNRNK